MSPTDALRTICLVEVYPPASWVVWSLAGVEWHCFLHSDVKKAVAQYNFMVLCFCIDLSIKPTTWKSAERSIQRSVYHFQHFAHLNLMVFIPVLKWTTNNMFRSSCSEPHTSTNLSTESAENAIHPAETWLRQYWFRLVLS